MTVSAIANAKALRDDNWLEWWPVLAGLLVLYVPTVFDLSTSIWQSDEHAHGPIILAIVVWLIWEHRAALATTPTRPAPLAGLFVLVLGLLFYAVGRSQDIIMFEVGSLAPVLAGIALTVRGWSALRALWFPLVFLAFLVPLPGVMVDALTGPLKQAVSAIAEQLLYAAGYPIARNGVTLTMGQYQLLVADACSGLNSMFSLSALGLLYVHRMHHLNWWHRGLLLASILPIAFCANVVRVLGLLLATYYFGEAFAQGLVHGFSGMVLFLLALMILLAFDALLRLSVGLSAKAHTA